MVLEIQGEQAAVDAFQWIWGQYVNGFDGSKHCLPCLKGVKEKQVTAKMKERVIELRTDYPYFYLFAMGSGSKRLTNVHLPVQPFPGAVASTGSVYGVTFTITDAVQIRVDTIPNGWRNLPEPMTRCKNFQFGVQVFPNSPVPSGPLPEEVVNRTAAEAEASAPHP